jgi:plasmid stabilization system protein ParE
MRQGLLRFGLSGEGRCHTVRRRGHGGDHCRSQSQGRVCRRRRYNASFERLYDILADFPGAGPPRPALGAHIRSGVVLPYIVIYSHTETDGVVRVLRIVHGSRRISGKLLRGAS